MRKTTLLAVLAFALFAAPARAQTVTGYKTGEHVTGTTKQCFYDALGSEYTLTLRAIDLCPLTVQVRAPTPSPSPPPPPEPSRTIVAYKVGERTSGQTKQCYYTALGAEYTQTVSSVSLCPLTIRVRP